MKSAAGLINKILDPIVAKRTGVSNALLNSWGAVVGEDLAKISRPSKVKWPKRPAEEDEFHPGTLIVIAEGVAALHIQHQTGQVIDRVNAFLGYKAIDRIKLVQKPVDQSKPKKRIKKLSDSQKRKVSKLAESIEDDELRLTIQRFGENVMRDQGKR